MDGRQPDKSLIVLYIIWWKTLKIQDADWDKISSSPVKTTFLPVPFFFKQRGKYFCMKTEWK
jgi:hypothetical protein